MERAGFDTWKAKEVARLLALLEGERRYYQEIAAALPVPVAVLATDRTVAWANRAFRRAVGLSAEELRGRAIEQILPAEDLSRWIAELHSGRSRTIAAQVGLAAYRVTGVPLTHPDEETAETLLVLELGGEAAEREASPLPREAPAVVWQADPSTLAFRWVAGAALELLGYPSEQWIARPGFFEQRIHPEDREAVMALYRSALESGSAAAEFRMVAADGRAVWCREVLHAGAGTLTGVLTGIEARKQIECQLLAAERMDALQAFAGRLAHDLNNPLMIAAGYAEEILQALPASSPLRAEAVELGKATARLSEIVGSLTEFARRSEVRPARVNLSETLPALEPRFRQAAGPGAAVEIVPPAAPVWAMAGGELTQVLETFAGAGAGDRKRLTVSWGVEEVKERTSPATLPPGRYACIHLRSEGAAPGVRPASWFDPGSPGKPGSFAMSLAYLSVRQWGGDVAAWAEEASWRLNVYLPLSEPAGPPPSGPPPRRASILVVDDEAGIRGLILKILKREHYEVIEAASAEEALQAAAARGAPIDLLLTDVVLPGMPGTELARRMHAAQPSLKVLYISGYTPDEAARSGKQPPGARFLAKPFTLAALIEAVRETLQK
jgi:CheY-like chemotaxis protein